MNNQNHSLQLQQGLLGSLASQRHAVEPITSKEHANRVQQLAAQLKQADCDAIYLHGGTNLLYFTGVNWKPSERVCGAIIDADANIHYIMPFFEIGTFSEMIQIPQATGERSINSWHEHENAYQLIDSIINEKVTTNGKIALDANLPFDMYSQLNAVNSKRQYHNGASLISACRLHKSTHEIALIQHAMNLTLEVQKLVKSILYPGIATDEIHQFIDKAHRLLGFDNGAYFSIVLFGKDSSFPHGVKNPQPMQADDVVLIDCGGQMHGYHSDITRTYFHGTPTSKQQQIWHLERELMYCVFNAAEIGKPCSNMDKSVREKLVTAGLGPDYQLPGVAHRSGHGLGLDIHEPPYLIANNDTLLAKGMCFSNEPMICMPDEYGIRIEDHIYMDDNGPVWFTTPPDSWQQGV